jgi:hypothetical protein
MRVLYKIILGITLIALIFTVLTSQWMEQQEQKEQKTYEETFSSDYTYTLSISSTGTLRNVTLYILLPGPETQHSFGNATIGQKFSKDEPAWNYTLVETEYGPMLSIENKEIRPRFYSRYEDGKKVTVNGQEEIHLLTSYEYSEKTPFPFSIDFGMRMLADHVIDTRNPLGNEPVFTPMYNVTGVNNKSWSRAEKTYQYDSRMYAKYDTSENATVDISIVNCGSNSWWVGRAWGNIQGNFYTDSASVQLSGPQDGWVIVNGELATGEGTYLEE